MDRFNTASPSTPRSRSSSFKTLPATSVMPSSQAQFRPQSFYTLHRNFIDAFTALKIPSPPTSIGFSVPKMKTMALSALSKDTIDQAIEQRFFNSPPPLPRLPGTTPAAPQLLSPLLSPSSLSETTSSPLQPASQVEDGEEAVGARRWYKPFSLPTVYDAQRNKYEFERQRWIAIVLALKNYHSLAVREAERVTVPEENAREVMDRISTCVSAAEQLVQWWRDMVISPSGVETSGDAKEKADEVETRGNGKEKGCLVVENAERPSNKGGRGKGRNRKKKRVTWGKVPEEQET